MQPSRCDYLVRWRRCRSSSRSRSSTAGHRHDTKEMTMSTRITVVERLLPPLWHRNPAETAPDVIKSMPSSPIRQPHHDGIVHRHRRQSSPEEAEEEDDDDARRHGHLCCCRRRHRPTPTIPCDNSAITRFPLHSPLAKSRGLPRSCLLSHHIGRPITRRLPQLLEPRRIIGTMWHYECTTIE